MATLTITVRNTLRLYGVEPHNKWGTLVWGTSTWAEQDVKWLFRKRIFEDLFIDSTQSFKVKHLISESMTLDSSISRKFPAWIYENISITSRITSVYRINNGWYVQRGDTTNALNFPNDNFTEVVEPSTTWTTVTTPSIAWTQL